MKKILSLIVLGLGLILVACSSSVDSYQITYHTNTNIEETNSIVQKSYTANHVLQETDYVISKEGYVFKGWYSNKELTAPITFPYTVKDNEDFYAKWAKLYTVIFMVEDEIYQAFEVEEKKTVPTLENPTQEGSSFSGWQTRENMIFDFSTPITEDITLIAKFEENKYIVTFYDEDKVVKSESVTHGNSVNIPENPSKEGHIFKGWSTSKTEYRPFDQSTSITTDTSLYAFYDLKKFTVEYFVDQTSYVKQIMNYNSKASNITPSTKPGYAFVGWYTKEDTLFDFETPITEDLALYAKYEKTTIYTVTFQMENQTSSVKVNKNDVVPIPNTPTKEGYTFLGWFNGTTEFDFATPITEDITLIAKFEITLYNVDFYVEGELLNTEKVAFNTTVSMPSVPSKNGYDFKGWSINKDIFTPFNESTKITDHTTLYAYYEKQTFIVTFIINNEILDTKTVQYGDFVSSITPPTQLGYTFVGWFAEENYTKAFDFATPISANTTIYGKLDPVITYTITFKNEDIKTTQKVNKNDVVTIPDTPTKEGYTFLGWFNGTTEFDFATPITEDITLVAKFEINSFTVKFFNGTTLVKTETIVYGNTVSLPAAPEKEGYTFKGWSTSSTAYQSFDETSKINKDLNIYAYFEINSYTVTFIADTIIVDTLTISYQNKVTSISAPSKDGYTFEGWFLSETSNTPFDFSTPITENITLIAKYKETITFTVTFQIDNEKTTTIVNEGECVTEPEKPIKEGYAFLGWYYDDVKFNFSTPIADDIILIARFEKESFIVTNSGAYQEGLFVEFNKLSNTTPSDYTVEYKAASSTTYTKVAKELIREKNDSIRFDIIGLNAGEYDVRLSANDLTMTRSFSVVADDRSGYAHFGYTKGIGAYNDDGTLKNNAVVVYVTDENKNTVTAKIGSKTYTGLVNIIQACTNASYALDIRILGEIQTTQWNSKTHGKGSTSDRQNDLENTFKYTEDSSAWDKSSSSNYDKLNEKDIIAKGINSMSSDLAKGITQLNGLTNQVIRNKKATSAGVYEYDSYYNMLDVSGGQNITIEGIGTDAAIFQWGFAFKKCNSIEIKNLRFYNYTEDAVGFEGSSGKQADFGNYWVHNCTFDLGVNNWDVCYENDKTDGDGSTDVKYCHNVTISYTQYNKTHKTNLIGSSDSAKQYNITLHHNYYNQCGSRLPLVRQANIHMYNNYYYGSTSYSSSIRANCYAFVENCYYDGGKNPYEVVTSSTYSKTAAKYYNNYFNNVTSSGNYKKVNTVSSRTQTVSGGCTPNDSTDYSNFDTNTALFYYDATNKVSKVKNLLDPLNVPEHCKTYSGVLKSKVNFDTTTPEQPDVPDTPGGDEITWNTVFLEDFSSNQTITEINSGDTIPSGISYYYSGGTSGSSTNNNLSIKNNSLQIIDTSDATTYGYYMFDQTYSTGKVKISIDFTPTTSNGKWTPIHFLDGNNNIGIRTNDSKILGYTIDSEIVNGSSTPIVCPVLNEAITANKTYHIELILDYDNNTASILINDATVTLVNYTCRQINGIMFQTAGSNSRSFSVDNIKIEITS